MFHRIVSCSLQIRTFPVQTAEIGIPCLSTNEMRVSDHHDELKSDAFRMSSSTDWIRLGTDSNATGTWLSERKNIEKNVAT